MTYSRIREVETDFQVNCMAGIVCDPRNDKREPENSSPFGGQIQLPYLPTIGRDVGALGSATYPDDSVHAAF